MEDDPPQNYQENSHETPQDEEESDRSPLQSTEEKEILPFLHKSKDNPSTQRALGGSHEARSASFERIGRRDREVDVWPVFLKILRRGLCRRWAWLREAQGPTTRRHICSS
ncbi:unnamed protein product [Malus baccata var. baccata]